MTNAATQIQAQLGVDNALFRKQSNNASWSELANGVEAKVRDQIAGSTNLAEQIRIVVDMAGTSNGEFQTFYTGVMRDLKIYAQRWSALASRRNGRLGVIQDPAEYTDYLSLGLEFVSLSEEMAIVVPDTLFNLQEHHHFALETLRKRAEEANVAEADGKPELVSAEGAALAEEPAAVAEQEQVAQEAPVQATEQ
jgi:hypothetical protein